MRDGSVDYICDDLDYIDDIYICKSQKLCRDVIIAVLTIKINYDNQLQLNAIFKVIIILMYAMNTLLSSTIFSWKTELKCYIIILQPMILYSAGTWTLTKINKTFENKISRKIFGPISR